MKQASIQGKHTTDNTTQHTLPFESAEARGLDEELCLELEEALEVLSFEVKSESDLKLSILLLCFDLVYGAHAANNVGETTAHYQ